MAPTINLLSSPLRKYTFILIVCCVFFIGAAHARPLQLNELPTGSLGTWAEIYVEDGRTLSLDEAQTQLREGKFQGSNKSILSEGIGAKPRWLHFELVNPTATFLALKLAVGTTWTDKISVYLVHDNLPPASWQTGDELPNSPELTPGIGYTLSPNFAPGRSDLFLRVESIDPLIFPIELMTEKEAVFHQHLAQYSYGIIFGFLIALTIYNALLFAGLRKRSYLYYALYLASLILLIISFTGHGSAWFWPGQPQIQRYVILVTMVVYGCCGLLFASRFLEIKKHLPHTYKWVQAFVALGAVAIVFSVMLGSQLAAARISFIFVALFSLWMVFLGLLSIRNHQVSGPYFFIAALFGVLGSTSTTLAVWGGIPFISLTYHAIEYGMLIEATLFALALSHHYSEMSENLAKINALNQQLSMEITERNIIESKLRMLSVAIEQSPASVIITDLQARIEYINPAFMEATGYSSVEAIGQTPNLISSGETPKEIYKQLWDNLTRGLIWKGEIQNKRKNGELFWEETHIAPVKDAAGNPTNYVAVKIDVTDRKRLESEVRQLAFFDVLTNLPNRRLLNDRLTQSLIASKRTENYGAVMFLDLDNFKPLNDTHGHVVGDLLLIEAANRLKTCVRELDTVARFGGDEFVVMLSELDVDKTTASTQARVVAEKILAALSSPYVLIVNHDGKLNSSIEHRCTASIGVAMFINHEGSQDDILNWADAAMYQAKEAGRNSIRFYET